MSKGFWAIIAIVIVLFGGLVIFGGNKKENKSSSGKSNSDLSQNIQGSGSTGVVLVEYGDYQCPFCEQYYPTVKAVTEQYKDKIKFQFRHFPLTNLHRNAFAASRAAQAAALQNKFWEMHDSLYDPTNNRVWTEASNPNPYFDQYASNIGLNVTQFKKDFASSQVNDTINADMAEGNKLGITGTPTFFIDGKKTEIANDLKAFQKVIDASIASKAAAKSN
jgi:protein-disulfide isomerase